MLAAWRIWKCGPKLAAQEDAVPEVEDPGTLYPATFPALLAVGAVSFGSLLYLTHRMIQKKVAPSRELMR
jgi:hypothetical protein